MKFPRSHPITQQGKEVIKQMLQKEPEKRLQLIDLVQQEYNLMDEEEFAVMYEKACEEFE